MLLSVPLSDLIYQLNHPGISSLFILAGTFNVSLLQRFSPYKIAHADGQT